MDWLQMINLARKLGAHVDEENKFYVCPNCDCIIYPEDIVNPRYLCPFCERMAHNRAHIRLIKNNDAVQFVQGLNSLGTIDKYVIENGDGSITIDARSFLGVIYAMTEFNDEMYLVNTTNDGKIPSFVDEYRV